MLLSPWTNEDCMMLEVATTFENLNDIALKIITRMPQPLGQVCGPISTGGVGNLEGNIAVFEQTIRKLKGEGRHIFDQLPFEKPMWRIIKTPYYRGPDHLLEAFYLPIFKSGYIKALYFIPNWQTSYGANWEHKLGKKLGIEIIYL